MAKKFLFTLFIFLISYSCFAQDTSSFAELGGNVIKNTNYSFADFNHIIPTNTKEIIAWHSKLTEKGDTITSKSESNFLV